MNDPELLAAATKAAGYVKAAWKKAGITPRVTPMAIELNIPM